MPIFNFVPDSIIRLIKHIQCPHAILNPSTVRSWLRGNIKSNSISHIHIAMRLLEYVCQDGQIDQLYGLSIFLCRNGKLQSLSKIDQDGGVVKYNSRLYIGTQEESMLFDKNGELFLSVEKYPGPVQAALNAHISSMSVALNLTRFDLRTFACYMSDVLFSSQELSNSAAEAITMMSCGVDLTWIQNLWRWLDSMPVEVVSKSVQSRWLIPLEGRKRLRKVFCSRIDVYSVDRTNLQTSFDLQWRRRRSRHGNIDGLRWAISSCGKDFRGFCQRLFAFDSKNCGCHRFGSAFTLDYS